MTEEIRYYSAASCSFVLESWREAYNTAGTWPVDAVEVTDEQWNTYGAGQIPEGRQRGADAQGLPAWIEIVRTIEEQQASERVWRDRQLLASDPLVTRHRDELEAERPTSLRTAQYKQLQAYRLDLRDWPESEAFPDATRRPVEPDWLADYLA